MSRNDQNFKRGNGKYTGAEEAYAEDTAQSTEGAASKQGTAASNHNRSNSNKRRRGKGYSGNGKYSGGRADASSTNHTEWYTPDPVMLKDAASFPFAYKTGDPIALGASVSPYYVPGLIRINYFPTLGEITSPSSDANVGANAVYSFIRKANSGSRNYDAQDFMLYLMTADSIYTGIAWFQRLLFAMNMYLLDNRYTPEILLKSMGVQFNSALIGDQPKIRLRLNQVIFKANCLTVPKVFAFFDRHMQMCSNFYTDEENYFSQLYYFNPDYLYKYSLNASTKKGQLIPVAWGNNLGADSAQPWETYMEKLEDMVNRWYSEEDSQIMSGDIQKAYTPNQWITLGSIPDGLVAKPVYDINMLHQIHNLDMAGPYVSGGTIEQGIATTDEGLKGYLTSDPCFYPGLEIENWCNQTHPYFRPATLLDLHIENTPEAIMRSTRLKNAGYQFVSEGKYRVLSPGTEVVTTVLVTTRQSATTTSSSGYIQWDFENPKTSSNILAPAIISCITAASYFPLIYRSPLDDFTPANGLIENIPWVPIGNTDRVTRIDCENIRSLNQTATLGLFNIKGAARGETVGTPNSKRTK